jgi:hypothetical protein
VIEEVTAYEPRSGQTLAVEDEQVHATQRVLFTPGQDSATVTLELDWRLKEQRPFMALVDVLFVRRQQREALQRTLRRFRTELASESEAAADR